MPSIANKTGVYNQSKGFTSILLQWMCVFFALAMVHLNKTLSKPFELELPREGFADDKPKPFMALPNNTTNVRSKRNVIKLRDLCSRSGYWLSSPASSNSCVKGWFFCHDYQEAVCNLVSFRCLSNVREYGYPKCKPIYDFVQVKLKGKTQKVRRTKNCHCA